MLATSLIIFTIAPGRVSAQDATPAPGYRGKVMMRNHFISYEIREQAEKGEFAKNQYYIPLEFSSAGDRFTSQVDVPRLWLERRFFVCVEGEFQAYTLLVNGREAGRGHGSHTALQFDISEYMTDGANSVTLVHDDGNATAQLEDALSAPAGVPSAYVFSQPRICIEDFDVRFEPDSTGGHGIFELRVILSNGYNYDEDIRFGYDLFSPQNSRQTYNMADLTMKGSSRDTLYFREPIWRANNNFWSAENPVLHSGMLYLRRDTRMIEYIAFKVGYGRTELSDGRIMRNGKVIDMKASRYNAPATRKEFETQVAALKKQGVNTLCPDYPQPLWFYEVCDAKGMYVVDRADINARPKAAGRKVGGDISNDPAWLGAFEERTLAMYSRNRNRTCIVGRSLGGNAGNGYNMYRTYLLLKRLDPEGIVIFDGAGGEWNTDLPAVPGLR